MSKIKTLKDLTIGITIGTLLSTSIVFAQPIKEYILKQSDSKIIINGIEHKGDSLILNYNGTTYVSLRTISEMLNVKIEWDGDNNSILIGDGKVNNVPEIKLPVQIPDEIDKPNEPNNNVILKTTYQGIKAIEVNGEIYFSGKEYNDKFDGERFISYNAESSTYTFYKNNELVNEIPTNSINVIIYQYDDLPGSYIHVKYY